MTCTNNYSSKPTVVPVLDFSLTDIIDARNKGNILSIDIEITEACNFSCVYCYRYQSNGPQPVGADELNSEQIIKLLTSATKKHGLKRVCILGGEPLMPIIRDKYVAVLKACNELGLEHITFTNGYALDRETAVLLKELKASVCIKLNAMEANTHDQLVGQKGSFALVMEAFETLQELGFGKDGLQLAFESVVTQSNYEQITDMWQWARSKDIVPYVEILTEQGRSATRAETLIVSNEKLEILFKELQEIDKNNYGLEWDVIPPIAGGHKCLRYYMSIYVRSNGDICPCVGVSEKMGNYPANSIAEILDSELARKTRYIDQHIKGKCKTCDLKSTCYGCRGAAFQAGDLFGEDPVCWRNEKS
ncbi:MAG: radical SAM protein [Desulfotalea sp.]